ncbi:MAG TPA: acyl-CoA dehydrogenase family protein [Burkholderiales bacterium]|nr:acyl-CoA dehydrogenase family protein [Burkholderiales bacterium]
MDFDLTQDQRLFKDSVTRLLDKYRALPAGHASYWLDGSAVRKDLEEGGFLSIATQEGCGPFEALLLVEAVAMLPQAVEVAASALVAPAVGAGDCRGPVALASTPVAGRPVRFLPGAATLIVDSGADVQAYDLAGIKVPAVDTPFAAPFGIAPDLAAGAGRKLGASRKTFLQWRQVALAGEIVGAMQAALDLTVQYVKDRQQFGHPLGSFQAIQHRLSECAVLVHGARLSAYRAALSGSAAHAALACSYAQDASARVSYDTPQFHGAIGQTLEYPVHYWAYRLRALQGELDGVSTQGARAADELWPA